MGHPTRRSHSLLAAALLFLAGAAAPARAQEPPRLVVFISIDQMRGDYITRFGPQWTGGLKRLVDDGALFVQSAYPYFNTVTCAGHATMSTGAFPSTHGMILNAWYDRATGKTPSCTDDPSVSPVVYGKGGAGAGDAAAGLKAVAHSASLLRTRTFADELRGQAARPPRVVTMSMKPRSAVNLAGHAGDLVVWFNEESGWTSSTAFSTGKVPFMEKYVASHPIARDFDTPWTKLLPEKAYLFDDAAVGEKPPAGWTSSFPHPFKTKEQPQGNSALWVGSPFSDAYLGALAIAAVDEFKLGQTPGTDFLGVSFSAVDGVGHNFGPRSHEVQDTLFRLDRTIGDLLAALDAKVGAGRYVVALTGDHGVAPIPEQMEALGFDAGRVDLKTVRTAIDQALAGTWGAGNYVAHIAYTDVYFAPGIYDRLKADPAAMKLVIDTIEQVNGIARVVRGDELRGLRPDVDRLGYAFRLSYVPDRSGDIYIQPKPYWLMATSATTHGTGYLYDQRVPVLLFGAGIKGGKYWGAASPADLAPTLAALTGVTMSNPDGRVLSEALSTTPGATAAHQTATR